jgi:transposase
MGRRRSYDDEFKKEAVLLVVEDGQTIRSVEESLGITQGVLKDWVKAYRQGSASEGETDKDQVIRKLEKELERVKREREILKKAVAIFSKDPNPYSGS